VTARLVVLDESKQRRHGILSVGGIVLDLSMLHHLEDRWRRAREDVGIASATAVKYSMSWPGGPDQRAHLIATIGELQVQAVIALLEDFRPLGMKVARSTRKDAYIQRCALEWTLQRLARGLYIPEDDDGPHLVMIDGRDDFTEFERVYARGYSYGWPHMPYHSIPPLRERGFSASLLECSNGPVHEIADLLTSCVTRWADERCIHHKGGKADDVAELDSCVSRIGRSIPYWRRGAPAAALRS
jgi:hypothetical protein